MNQFTKPQLIILGIVGFIILFFSLVFLGVIPGLRRNIGGSSVKLEFWGVGDEGRVWEESISKFNSAYPNVSVKYTKLDGVNYENRILDALAASKGPDIFIFHNSWLPKHGNKIVPATPQQIPLSTFRNLFPVVAEQDFVNDSRIFALPIYIDTLALFYNRDIFDNKKIALSPTTWDEVKSTILKTRELNSKGGITKAGLSVGGTIKSVPNATDILSLLMLQFRTPMVSQDGSNIAVANSQGVEALNFYTQFSKPGKPYYTWADSLKPSIDSFGAKQTAMIFAYASEIPEIKAKNPALNFAVAPAPQFNKSEAVNFPNYWGLVASTKTSHPKEAWDFIVFVATNSEVASNYASLTGKPPALRSLIDEYLVNPNLGVFAAQALTARSWSQPDNVEVRRVFNNMIESVTSGRLSAEKALREAEDELNSLIRG